MRRVSPTSWLVILAAYLSAHAIGAVKWRLMVNSAGADLTLAQTVRCYCAGLCGNLFLPSLVGGDVIRIGLGLRFAQNKAGVLLGSFLDRFLDVTVLATMATVGTLLLPRALGVVSLRVFWVLAAGLCLLGAAALALYVALRSRRFSYRTRRRIAEARKAVRLLFRQPRNVLLALALGIAIQTSFVGLMAWVGAACGITVPFTVWLFVFPLSTLSALLPVTQGGIGVREAALAALLVPFGVSAVLSVAVGFVLQSIVIAGGLLAGLISLWVGRVFAATPGWETSISSLAEGKFVSPRP